MGKKRIATGGGNNKNNALRSRALSRGGKRKLTSGVLHVESTYNNTRVSLTDLEGNMFFTSSSGALGFKGAKKGTPFAAAKVGEFSYFINVVAINDDWIINIIEVSFREGSYSLMAKYSLIK